VKQGGPALDRASNRVSIEYTEQSIQNQTYGTELGPLDTRDEGGSKGENVLTVTGTLNDLLHRAEDKLEKPRIAVHFTHV
jgi:hypothetical protein